MTRDEWKSTWPLLIKAIAANWRLEVEPPFPALSYNDAAPAIRDRDVAQTVLSACWFLEDDDPDWRIDAQIEDIPRAIKL